VGRDGFAAVGGKGEAADLSRRRRELADLLARDHFPKLECPVCATGKGTATVARQGDARYLARMSSAATKLPYGFATLAEGKLGESCVNSLPNARLRRLSHFRLGLFVPESRALLQQRLGHPLFGLSRVPPAIA